MDNEKICQSCERLMEALKGMAWLLNATLVGIGGAAVIAYLCGLHWCGR